MPQENFWWSNEDVTKKSLLDQTKTNEKNGNSLNVNEIRVDIANKIGELENLREQIKSEINRLSQIKDGNNRWMELSLLNNRLKNIDIMEFLCREYLLKLDLIEQKFNNKQRNNQNMSTNAIGVDWNVAIVEKDEGWNNVLHIQEPKNEIIDAKNIIDGFIWRFPRQEKFLRSIIIPNVKITWAAYAEIYKQLEPALFSLDLNTQPTIVYWRRWEINRVETLNFADPKSTNPDVQNLRAIVREMNAKYFTKSSSPFIPALYN